MARLHRRGARPRGLCRRHARPRMGRPAPPGRDPAAQLLRPCRHRIHAHRRRRGTPFPAGPDRGARQGHHLHARGQEGDPGGGDPRRGIREVPRQEVRRHQALRPRRRRIDDPGARSGDQVRRRARRARDRLRHVAPRPAERARQRHGQALPRDLPRILRRQRQSRTMSAARATSSTTSAPAPTANSTGSRCT